MQKDLRSLAFLVLCFALGVGLAEAYIHLRHPPSAPTTAPGLGAAPPLHGFLLSPNTSANQLKALLPLHATAIALQYPNDPASLPAIIARAHALGLKVLLLPPPTPSDKNPFPLPLPQIAAQAQSAHADLLCISWLNTDPDPDYWQPLIAQIRKNFSGQLILAATPDLLPGIEFFNTVDFIGAVGPFQLPIRTPTLAHPLTLQDLRTAWACSLDSIESLSHRYAKRAILFDPAAPTPPALSSQSNVVPLRYEALLTESDGRDATEGLFISWNPASPTPDPTVINAYPELLTRIPELWTPNPGPRPPATSAVDTEPDDTDP